MATPVRGRSSRAAQAEQTRQQILDTARRLFAEYGYDATSIQMIADELGLTKAAVYYHFRAKSDMLHAALQPGIQRLAVLLDEAETMRGRRARMVHLVDGLVEFLVANRQHFAFTSSSDPATRRQKFEEGEGGSAELRRRALRLFYGDHPTGAERLLFNAVLGLAESLPELTDLSDGELSEALRSTMLRILRIPPSAARSEAETDADGDAGADAD